MDQKFYEELIGKALGDQMGRFVVGAVIKKGSRFLLLERPKDDFMGGIFELASGKVEEEEFLDQALIREVLEETGLKIKEIVDYLGYFDYESKSGKKTRQFNFIVVVEDDEEVKLTEHDSHIWVEKEELEKYPVTESVKKILSSL